MSGWQARLYQRAVDIPAFFIHKQPNFIKQAPVTRGEGFSPHK